MSAYKEISPIKSPKKTQLLFGTGGIRSLYGQFPLTSKAIVCLGRALGLFTKQLTGQKTGQVIIMSDTRNSCKQIFDSLALGLAAEETNIIDCGVLPTPATSCLLENFAQAGLAIVISASHNTHEFNGIKIFTRQGKLSPQEATLVSSIFDFFYQSNEKALAGSCPKIELQAELSAQIYISSIVCQFEPKDFITSGKIILDCANGAAWQVAPKIFQSLGINTVAIASNPSGTNINQDSGSTCPRNLTEAIDKHKALFGISLDGDADRVVCSNSFGQLKDGDDILCLLAGSQDSNSCPNVVGTIMSNSGLELHLKKQGQRLLRSGVGEAKVIEMLKQNNSWLGGEPSGHILAQKGQQSSDGIFAALSVLKATHQSQNYTMDTFERFYSNLFGIKAAVEVPLHHGPVFELIESLKIRLESGRIFARYSQTEPILRILVESQNQTLGQEIVNILKEKIIPLVSQIKPTSDTRKSC